MKHLAICIILCTLAACAFAGEKASSSPGRMRRDQQSQSAPTVASVANAEISLIEEEFVGVARAMPEDKYNFAPTSGEFKGVRTFAEEVKHVAAANYRIWSAALQEKPSIDLSKSNGPDSIRTKAEIVKFLKDSYVLGHRAATSLTRENMLEEVPFGAGKAARLYLVTYPVGHAFDHYGQAVEYLRMNGIIPPASRAN